MPKTTATHGRENAADVCVAMRPTRRECCSCCRPAPHHAPRAAHFALSRRCADREPLDLPLRPRTCTNASEPNPRTWGTLAAAGSLATMAWSLRQRQRLCFSTLTGAWTPVRGEPMNDDAGSTYSVQAACDGRARLNLRCQRVRDPAPSRDYHRRRDQARRLRKSACVSNEFYMAGPMKRCRGLSPKQGRILAEIAAHVLRETAA